MLKSFGISLQVLQVFQFQCMKQPFILFSILLLFALISFIFIIIYRNEEGLREGILGKYSKFHFIPILCATSLYIIGEAYGVNNLINDAPYAFSIIFSIIGLCSLIFIYIQTSMPKLNARLAIKKGLYSSLIVLFVYKFMFYYHNFRPDENIISQWIT